MNTKKKKKKKMNENKNTTQENQNTIEFLPIQKKAKQFA